MVTVLDILHTLFNIFFTRIVHNYYYPHPVHGVQSQIFSIQTSNSPIPDLQTSYHTAQSSILCVHRRALTVIGSGNDPGGRLRPQHSRLLLQRHL